MTPWALCQISMCMGELLDFKIFCQSLQHDSTIATPNWSNFYDWSKHCEFTLRTRNKPQTRQYANAEGQDGSHSYVKNPKWCLSVAPLRADGQTFAQNQHRVTQDCSIWIAQNPIQQCGLSKFDVSICDCANDPENKNQNQQPKHKSGMAGTCELGKSMSFFHPLEDRYAIVRSSRV